MHNDYRYLCCVTYYPVNVAKQARELNKKGNFVFFNERNISHTGVLTFLNVKTIFSGSYFVKVAILIPCSPLPQETASVLRQ